MRKTLLYIYALCLSCLCVSTLSAQEAETRKKHYRDIGFSATDYSLQKRYRPTNQGFVSDRFLDNTFISVYGESQHIFPVGDRSVTQSYQVGGSLGKWFTPYHGLRLDASAATMHRNWDNYRINSIGVDASYMFNISSFLWGYKKNRFADLSAVLGLGARASLYHEAIDKSFNAHMGFNLAFKVGQEMDLFFEPMVYFTGNGVLMAKDYNWRGYNPSAGAKVGLTYNISPKGFPRDRVDYTDGAFLSISGGPQFILNSDFVYNTLSLFPSLGRHLAISYGKIYKNSFGFRTSALMSDTVFATAPDNRNLKSDYKGLRLEAMYNPLSLIKGLDEKFPLSTYLLVGPEAGIIAKETETYGKIRHPYVGVASGLQLKYKLVDVFSIFLEPRMTAVYYSQAALRPNEGEEKRSNYHDILFNANFGIELAFDDLTDLLIEKSPYFAQMRARQEFRRNADKDARKNARELYNTSRFIDDSFFSVFGDAQQIFAVDGNTFSPAYSVGASFGRWMTPHHALRLTGSIGTLLRNTDGKRLKTAGAEVSYLLNLMGNDYNRFFEASTVMGFGVRASELEGVISPYLNAHVGLNAAMKVGKDMDLFIEPLLYVNGRGATQMADLNGGRFNTSAGLRAGLNYVITPKDKGRPRVDYMDGSFISIGGGMQFVNTGASDLKSSMGKHLMLSFGKTYRNSFGIRTSAFLSEDYTGTGDNSSYKDKYAGLRLEGMYNLIGINRNLADFPLSLSLLFGPEAGFVTKTNSAYTNVNHPYVGLTGGVQLKYEFMDAIALFVEPRMSAVTYSGIDKSRTEELRTNYIDTPFSMNFGMEFALSRSGDATAPKAGRTPEEFVSNRFRDNSFISAFVESQQMFAVGNNTFSPTYTVGASFGKWLGSHHGLRLAASVGTLLRNTDNVRLHTGGIDLSYLYNFMGLDSERFCDVSAVLGLGGRMSDSASSAAKYMNGHIGLNATMKVGTNADLFFEPLAYIHGKGATQMGDLNQTKFNASAGMKVGISYVMAPAENARPHVDYGDSFISVAGGVQYLNSEYVRNSLGLGNSLGKHIAVSFGKIYEGAFGFRTTGFISDDLRGKVDETTTELADTYVGLRLEAMYNLFSLNNNLKDSPVSLNLLLGPEAGIVSKSEYNYGVKHPYVGATGGVQLKYRFIDSFSMFVEPRFSAVFYSNLEDTVPGELRRNYRDVLANLNLGMEFSLSGKSESARRPAETFVSERFRDNTFVSVFGEAQQMFAVEGNTFSPAYTVGAGFGKWFDSYNGLRLTASVGTLLRNTDYTRIHAAGVDLSYLYDFMGLDSDRFCDLSAVIGLGARASHRNDSFEGYMNAHLGLNASMKVGDNTDLFFEPMAYFNGKGATQMKDLNHRFGNTSAGMKVGLNYVINPSGNMRPSVDYSDDTFISFAGGVQLLNSSVDRTVAETNESMGKHITVSFGKFYKDSFGFRTTGFYSDAIHGSMNGKNLKNKYLGLRLEAMYNLIGINRNLADFPLSINLLLGPEAGIVSKKEYGYSVRHPYVGATGGVQLKYEFLDAFAFFVEPRFTAAFYSNLDQTVPGELRTNYRDLLTNVNFGVEFSLPGMALITGRTAAAGYVKPAKEEYVSNRFLDNTFVTTFGEAQQIKAVGGDSFSPAYSIGVGFGKWLDSRSGLRLAASVGTMLKNKDNSRLHTAGLDLSYLINFMGLNSDRFCEISGVVGLGARVSGSKSAQDTYMNGHLGLNATMKVGKNADLFFEPLAYIHGKGATQIYTRKINSSAGVKVGINYVIAPTENIRPWVDYMDDTYVSISGGVQFLNSGIDRNLSGTNESMGKHIAVSFGKTYEDSFGFRTTGFYSDAAYANVTENELGNKYLGLRLEATYNLIGINRNLADFPLSLNLLLGPEAGIVNKEGLGRHPYVGATGGIQLKYRFLNAFSIFAEPRFSALYYSTLKNLKSPVRQNHKDVLTNLNFGIEFSLPGMAIITGRTASAGYVTPAKEVYVSNRFLDNTFVTTFGETQQISAVGGSTFSPAYTIGVGFGKWFDSRSGLRLAASVGELLRNKDNVRLHTVGLDLSYLLNFTGLNSQRFFELSGVVGVGARVSDSRNMQEKYMSGHLGLNATMKVGEKADLFFEPLAYIHGKGATQMGELTDKNINFSKGVKVGLNYVITPAENSRRSVDYNDSYIAVSGGIQSLKSFKEGSKGMDIALSFGKVYDDSFGFRTTGFYSDAAYANVKENELGNKYLGVRLEGTYNLLGINRNLADFPLSLNLLLGPEAGIVNKEGLGRHPYVGATGGIQLKYRFLNAFSIFAEPRFSALYYSTLKNLKSPVRQNHKDVLTNLNFGIEFSLPGMKELKRK